MVRILRETDATPLVQVASGHGILNQTIYLWRKRLGKRFGKPEAADMKRSSILGRENGKLRNLMTERNLEIEVLKELSARKW